MDLETVSDVEGEFSFTIQLLKGENSISIYAKDMAGNESEAKDIIITFDNEPPEIEITNPSSLSSTTEENKIQITGKTEPNAQVYLNDRRIIVDHDGFFRSQYYLQEGENQIAVLAKDRAGNETSTEINIRYLRF